MMERKVDVLGISYKICFAAEAEDERLSDCDGYCDWSVRQIVVRQETDTDNRALMDMDAYVRKVLRHEIVHAFLCECGLAECSGETDCWAMNETMVDWIARMGERIHEAWRQAECLDSTQ